MKSKFVVASRGFQGLGLGYQSLGLALLLGVSFFVGCGKKAPPPAPAAVTMSPDRVKMLITVLEGNGSAGPFGTDLKASAAERLGECGQMAKDAGAIPVLTKLSKSGKATKEAKEAAVAALAKLNGAAPAP
jgi:hypothetical protein